MHQHSPEPIHTAESESHIQQICYFSLEFCSAAFIVEYFGRCPPGILLLQMRWVREIDGGHWSRGTFPSTKSAMPTLTNSWAQKCMPEGHYIIQEAVSLPGTS